MQILGSVVRSLVLQVRCLAQVHFTKRSAMVWSLVSDPRARRHAVLLQQLANQLQGRPPVAFGLAVGDLHDASFRCHHPRGLGRDARSRCAIAGTKVTTQGRILLLATVMQRSEKFLNVAVAEGETQAHSRGALDDVGSQAVAGA